MKLVTGIYSCCLGPAVTCFQRSRGGQSSSCRRTASPDAKTWRPTLRHARKSSQRLERGRCRRGHRKRKGKRQVFQAPVRSFRGRQVEKCTEENSGAETSRIHFPRTRQTSGVSLITLVFFVIGICNSKHFQFRLPFGIQALAN